MQRWLIFAVITSSSCGGPGGAVESPSADPPAPCPDGAALHRLASAAWSDGALAVRGVWCVALRHAGDTRWWIAGEIEDHAPGTGLGGWSQGHALVTPAGEATWTERLPFATIAPFASEQQAVDLDGDGDDELAYVELAGEGRAAATSLVVVGLTEPRPEFSRTAMGAPDDDSCAGAWRTIDGAAGTRLVEIAPAGCASELRRYQWTGEELREVAR